MQWMEAFGGTRLRSITVAINAATASSAARTGVMLAMKLELPSAQAQEATLAPMAARHCRQLCPRSDNHIHNRALAEEC